MDKKRNSISGVGKVKTDSILISADIQKEIDSFVKALPPRNIVWTQDMDCVIKKYYTGLTRRDLVELMNRVFKTKSFNAGKVSDRAYFLGIRKFTSSC